MSDALPLATLQDALAGVWSIEREIGRGGMGTVYLAREVALDRPVALKVLAPALAADPEQRARFLREARVGARLTHPHIVPVYAVGEAADTVYIAMGYVDGESLAERLFRAGPLAQDEAERLLREVGWALGYAHAMGVLHRDVTLDNILVDRHNGRAMLADFGIAAEIAQDTRAPLQGTPAYLAPELVQGEAATPRSDLYSLGIVAWAALAGRLPFTGDTAAVLVQHLSAAMPSLRDAAPATGTRLVRAIGQCLAREPGARPASVEAWLAQLEAPAPATTAQGPLAAWVDSFGQVRAFYALACSMTAVAGSLLVAERATLPPLMFLAVLTGLAALGPTLVAHAVIGHRLLRRAVAAGYGLEDLRLALRRHRASVAEAPPPVSIVYRVVTRIQLWLRAWVAMLLITAALMINTAMWAYSHDRFGVFLSRYILLSGLTAKIVFPAFWILHALQVVLPGPPSRLRLRALALRLRFWDSLLGADYFRSLARDTRLAAPPEETLHRPTELMLDLAIEDLWQALPAPSRQRVAELPALARTLRLRIAHLRELRQAIDTPGTLRHPEAVRMLEQLAARQTAGLTALERLRLLLLRLDDALPDEAVSVPLTIARQTERELLEALGAHRALHAHIRRRVTPTPSGVVTPA